MHPRLIHHVNRLWHLMNSFLKTLYIYRMEIGISACTRKRNILQKPIKRFPKLKICFCCISNQVYKNISALRNILTKKIFQYFLLWIHSDRLTRSMLSSFEIGFLWNAWICTLTDRIRNLLPMLLWTILLQTLAYVCWSYAFNITPRSGYKIVGQFSWFKLKWKAMQKFSLNSYMLHDRVSFTTK